LQVLRRLCVLFSHVYTLECVSVQNVLAICHQGAHMIGLDEWAELLGEARADPGFETVIGVPAGGGQKGVPGESTAGKWPPDGTHGKAGALHGGGGGVSASCNVRRAALLGGRGVGERALALDSLLDRLEYIGGKEDPPDL
jgi:hypothetical protein